MAISTEELNDGGESAGVCELLQLVSVQTTREALPILSLQQQVTRQTDLIQDLNMVDWNYCSLN